MTEGEKATGQEYPAAMCEAVRWLQAAGFVWLGYRLGVVELVGVDDRALEAADAARREAVCQP